MTTPPTPPRHPTDPPQDPTTPGMSPDGDGDGDGGLARTRRWLAEHHLLPPPITAEQLAANRRRRIEVVGSLVTPPLLKLLTHPLLTCEAGPDPHGLLDAPGLEWVRNSQLSPPSRAVVMRSVAATLLNRLGHAEEAVALRTGPKFIPQHRPSLPGWAAQFDEIADRLGGDAYGDEEEPSPDTEVVWGAQQALLLLAHAGSPCLPRQQRLLTRIQTWRDAVAARGSLLGKPLRATMALARCDELIRSLQRHGAGGPDKDAAPPGGEMA